jgi:uncharacterized membrane protein
MVQKFFQQASNVLTVLGLVLGVCYIILTPPFQVPDEINHFYRAYQVSQGDWRAVKKTDRLGGELPKALRDYTSQWEQLIGKPDIKTSADAILKSASIKTNDQVKAWYDFPNTAIYSPLNYLPQATGIRLSRLFSDSVMVTYYGSRLITLIFWLLVIRMVLILIPGKKFLSGAILLLPMSLYINSSLSADIMINAMSALLVAWVLHIRHVRRPLSMIQMILIIFIAALIPLLKIVYLPLLLLLALIPSGLFSSKPRYALFIIMVFAVGLTTAFSSLAEVDRLYIPYADYAKDAGWVHLAEGADKTAQTELVLKKPVQTARVVIRSIVHGFPMYSKGLIGTFGWLEFELPLVLVILSYLFLLVIAGMDQPLRMLVSTRITLVMTSFLVTLLLILSQYIIWTPVGGEIVRNLQGRYFIPLMLPLFLIIPGRDSGQIVRWTSLGFILLINSYSLIVIYERFFAS